jgi:D-lactate dehydrogenase (cytochrome)
MSRVIPSVEPKPDSEYTLPMQTVCTREEIRENYSDYITDESRLPGGWADEIVFPYSERQIVRTMQRAFSSETPVTLSAGRTGIVGGAVPTGGILVSFERMDRFLGARWDEATDAWIVRVQPGMSIQRLENILNSKNFNDVIHQDDDDRGEAMHRFTEESDSWFYPPDPTERTAKLSGTVATNASGARSFKYGQTRDYVYGLRIVLVDGTVLQVSRGDFISTPDKGFVIQKSDGSITVPIPVYKEPGVKNVAGYYINNPMDFIDYFIGSEGTLGVISEVELKLVRRPEFILGGVAFFSAEKGALEFIENIRRIKTSPDRRLDPSVLEYLDDRALNILRIKRSREGSTSVIPSFPQDATACIYFEQEGKNSDLEFFCLEYANLVSESGGNGDETWGGFDEKERRKMAAFRHAVAEEINVLISERKRGCPEIHKVGTDLVVPEGLENLLQTFHSKLESKNLEYVIFGHIGENHLHVNVLPRDLRELNIAKALTTEFAELAISMGGTVSGEHGIGKMKKHLLKTMFGNDAIAEMKRVKRAFDPKSLLNRGNLWDSSKKYDL